MIILGDDRYEVAQWVSAGSSRSLFILPGNYKQAMDYRMRFRGEVYLSDSQIRIITSAKRIRGCAGPYWLALVGSWEHRPDLAEICMELSIIRQTHLPSTGQKTRLWRRVDKLQSGL